MTTLQWTVVAGGSVASAIALFLATWLPRSLWRPPADDSTSRRIADRFVLRAAALVAGAVLVCGAIALVGAASGLAYGVVEVFAVCVLPAAALLLGEFLPIRSSAARGSVLRPRRLRELVPGVLLVTACSTAVVAAVLQVVVLWLGAQEPGTARANRWGLACRLPAGPQWPHGFETSPLVPWDSWAMVVTVAAVPAQVAAVAVVVHCHRRASLVADPVSDAGLRRCMATRSVAVAAVCSVAALNVGASALEGAANTLRTSAQPTVAWAARVPTARPPGIDDCMVSDTVMRVWSAVGAGASSLRDAGLVVLLLAVACYFFPGRAREAAAGLPTVTVG